MELLLGSENARRDTHLFFEMPGEVAVVVEAHLYGDFRDCLVGLF